MQVIGDGRMQTMTMSDWLLLVGLCVLYVVASLWMISRIFPGGQAAKSGTDTNNRRGPKT